MLGNIRIAQGLRSIPLKTHLAPLIIGVGALAIAVVGAFVVGGESATSGINSFVGRLSGSSGSSIRGIAPAAFGFAFVAGMVAAVNPCGCAMLPAYLGLYLGAQDGTQGGQNIALQLGKALIIGLVVTAGFLLLFGAVGLIIGGGGEFIKGVLPWTGLITGLVLALLGAWMLSGGKLYSNVATQVASRIGNPNQVSIRGYFLFGLSYGIASLSCTLPIFLAVLGTNLTVSDLPSALQQMVLYGPRYHCSDRWYGHIQRLYGGRVEESLAACTTDQRDAHDRRWDVHCLLLADPWTVPSRHMTGGPSCSGKTTT